MYHPLDGKFVKTKALLKVEYKPWIITFLVPLLLATPKLALSTHFCTAHRRKHVIPIFCVGGLFCQHLHACLSRSEEDLEKVTVRSEFSTWRVVLAVTFGTLYEEKIFSIVNPSAVYCRYAPCIGVNIVSSLVQPSICVNFHRRPYASGQETEYMAGLYQSVRFLHKPRVYIFELPIPAASCKYAPCISATIVPSLV